MINSYIGNIAKEEIDVLPLCQFNGEIIVADNLTSLRGAAKILQDYPVLGFDTETKPSFKKGHTNKVSILQLSTEDKCCIFRINKTGIQEELANILKNNNILKIGVAIKDDISSLRKLNHFEPEGFVDLQKYVESFGIKDKSLKKMAAIVLGNRISKSQQTSNWESENLSQPQLVYAATDAWICLEIYKRLKTIEKRHEGINKSHIKIG